MRYFKVYGKKYSLNPTANTAIDGYAHKGVVKENLPKGKSVGYVTLDDGSIVECFKSFNPIPLICLTLLVTTSIACYGVYLFSMQPKDLVNNSGYEIKTGVDNNVVMYNGFVAIREDALELDFQNGDLPVTVTVKGNGVVTETFPVAAGEYIETVPVTFTTDEEYVDAEITISTETSTVTNTVVVEIPSNQSSNDTSASGDNWRGEQIYGVR